MDFLKALKLGSGAISLIFACKLVKVLVKIGLPFCAGGFVIASVQVFKALTGNYNFLVGAARIKIKADGNVFIGRKSKNYVVVIVQFKWNAQSLWLFLLWT